MSVDPELSSFVKTIEFAQRAKAQMIERNMTRARKRCPDCGGMVRLVLTGRKNHLHMACETVGCMRLME